MKLYKIIEMYLKYDNMHTIGTINAFICINNHVNSCIKCMLSPGRAIVLRENLRMDGLVQTTMMKMMTL